MKNSLTTKVWTNHRHLYSINYAMIGESRWRRTGSKRSFLRIFSSDFLFVEFISSDLIESQITWNMDGSLRLELKFGELGSLQSSSPKDQFQLDPDSCNLLAVFWIWGMKALSINKYHEEGKLSDLFPFFNFWSSLLSHNFHDLSDFWLSSEEDFSLGNLIENAANRPNINSELVMKVSEKQFRSSIPQSFNFLWHGSEPLTDNPSKSEISDLDDSIAVDEDILWFEIPVKNLFVVKVGNSLNYLEHYPSE